MWFGLTAPDRLGAMSPSAFMQIPLELVLLAVLVVVVPARAARVTAAVLGVVLELLTVVKVLDLGFFAALDRPFDSVVDWRYLGSAVGLVDDSLGGPAAVGAVLLVALAVVGLLVLIPLSLLRRCGSRRGTGAGPPGRVALGAAWVVSRCSACRWQDGPVASTSASTYAYGQVSRIPAELRDQRAFAPGRQPTRSVEPAGRLLTGLRGKDVMFVFVESYGRVAVQGSSFSPRRRPGPRRRHPTTATRTASRARSAFLTSPTFGGDQLAGALHAPVGAVGRQPAALRRADDQPTGSP